ncbi:MAG: cupredoxin domain-containing protein [bacterium]|nr:cupredoxin domain-containing protein [bacterium]
MRLTARFTIPLLFLTLPFSASAVTAAELSAQVSALLQQVQALQQYFASQSGTAAGTGTNTGTSNSATCPQLGRALSVGSEGTDVTQLQTFLAADPSIYPEGKVTGYYGALTQAAVQRFQAQQSIVSSGSPESTGYGRVGPRTIAAIAQVCGTSSVNSPSSNDFGAVMQVTPITGAAPLHVVIQVTVNTTNTCAGAIYSLDFGDGTTPQPIPSSAGVCQPQSISLSHVYQYGGAYQVKLSSGSHLTYTTISVTGTTAPGAASAATQANIQVADSTFTPATLSVPSGTTINWINGGVVPHTVTANNNSFESGSIAPGQSYSVRFDQPGTYQYYCKFHGAPGSGMTGIITVTQAAAATGAGGGTGETSYGALDITLAGKRATAKFNTAGSCDPFSLEWGDDSNQVLRTTGYSDCSNSENLTLAHTYADPGTFTVTLGRGPGLAKEDTKAITIAN